MTDWTAHPVEVVPDGEAALINRVVDRQLSLMMAGNPCKRGQHPKQQALLRGRLEVAADAPPALRAGVFAAPRAFDALVRVSTGPQPRDCDANPHGFAIKLLDVEWAASGTQDFIMLDQPTFFIADMADYVAFFDAMTTGPEAMAAFYRDHPREYGLNQTFNVVIASHMERQYWSEVPIAFGNGAARLTLIPHPENELGRGPATTEDGLRDALEAHFVTNERPATFSLAAQGYVDEATTPIEDATSVWPTPFEIIATLRLPAQDFRSAERFALCENLSFTPWHCVPDHRPVGGIQRCRKRVYEESQRLRHGRNGAADQEPTSADVAWLDQ